MQFETHIGAWYGGHNCARAVCGTVRVQELVSALSEGGRGPTGAEPEPTNGSGSHNHPHPLTENRKGLCHAHKSPKQVQAWTHSPNLQHGYHHQDHGFHQREQGYPGLGAHLGCRAQHRARSDDSKHRKTAGE